MSTNRYKYIVVELGTRYDEVEWIFLLYFLTHFVCDPVPILDFLVSFGLVELYSVDNLGR